MEYDKTYLKHLEFVLNMSSYMGNEKKKRAAAAAAAGKLAFVFIEECM